MVGLQRGTEPSDEMGDQRSQRSKREALYGRWGRTREVHSGRWQLDCPFWTHGNLDELDRSLHKKEIINEK